MQWIDFWDRQNRYIRKEDVGAAYHEQMKERVAEDRDFYPTSHLVPPHGLLNDPNGLYQDQAGWYHIFYQWFPLGTVHGLKHWYHLKTRDFLHYESLGPAMSPDSPFDAYGCYTGMALVEEDCVHLYYTGIRKADQLLPATIHAVIADDQIKKTGIVDDIDLTKTTLNFRDPFVFKRADTYYMITGAENTAHQGMLLLSKGTSATDFQPQGTLKLKDYPYGYMLECPNYFETDAYGVLIFSPQGIQKIDPYDFQNVFSVVYAVGKPLDVESGVFEHDTFYELDKGFDFYAPQVFADREGRMILYGWLGNSKCEYPSDKFQWAHMLTLPRTLEVVGDRLRQWPLPELAAQRRKSAGKSLSKAFELVFALTDTVEIILENQHGEKLIFSGDQTEYCLDRSQTTHLYNQPYGQTRRAIRQVKRAHEARLFVDHSSIEIFADEGLTVFTGRFFLTGDWTLTVNGTSAEYYELQPLVLDIKKEY